MVEDFAQFFRRDKIYIDEYCLPSDICLISAAKNIEREFRFIIGDGKVITGSMYSSRGYHHESTAVDQEAWELAEKIASSNFNPDIAYVVDVCLSDDVYKILECGAVSCAGLYMGDTDKIVSSISELAWNAYISQQKETV